MTLEDRIVRLERQNRWMKYAAVASVGLFVTLGQSKPQDIIRARHFVIVDENGKVRGDFGFDEDGPRLVLVGKQHGDMLLTVSPRGPTVTLRSETGTATMHVYPTIGATMSVAGPGATNSVEIAASEAKSNFVLHNKSGTILMAGMRTGTPTLSIIDDSKQEPLFRIP